LAIITPKRTTLRVRINSPENSLAGDQQAYIEIDLRADVGQCSAERERIRKILTRAFSEILEEDIRATFEDEPEIWPENSFSWPMICEELLQDGYIPSRPDPLDAQMVEKISCENCEAGAQIAEGFRGKGYRVYAVCPRCGAYQEI